MAPKKVSGVRRIAAAGVRRYPEKAGGIRKRPAAAHGAPSRDDRDGGKHMEPAAPRVTTPPPKHARGSPVRGPATPRTGEVRVNDTRTALVTPGTTEVRIKRQVNEAEVELDFGVETPLGLTAEKENDLGDSDSSSLSD